MEFPKAFLLVTFYLFALVTANLGEDKRTAIEKMDKQVRDMKHFLKTYLDELELREYTLEEVLCKVERLGYEIWEDYDYLMTKTAKIATMMANLMRCSKDVFSCIDKHKEEGLNANYNYYKPKIANLVEDTKLSAMAHQRDIISKWRNDVDRAFLENSRLYEKSVREIQNTNNGETISSIVKNFEKETQKIGDIIKTIFPTMEKYAIEIYQQLSPHLPTYKKYVVNLVRETCAEIKKCVPK